LEWALLRFTLVTRDAALRVCLYPILFTAFAMLGGCALNGEASLQQRETPALAPIVGRAIHTEVSDTQPRIAQGCTTSGEPMHGAVEQAAGVVALIALVLGLRRRFARRDDAKDAARPRERYYSIP
jgi:hypothetical protein